MADTLTTIVATDPVIDFNIKKMNVAVLGGSQKTYYNLNMNAPPSLASATLSQSFTVPDSQGLVRKMMFNLKCQFSATMQRKVNNNNVPLVVFGGLGMAANAWYRIVQSLTVNVANVPQTYSTIPQTIDMLSRVNRVLATDWSYFSKCAATNDVAQNFNDVYLTAIDVLGTYATVGFGNNREPRTTPLVITSNPDTALNTDGVVQGTIDLYYPLVGISPFYADAKPRDCIVRAQQVSLNVNLGSDMTQLFSVNPSLNTMSAVTISGASVVLQYVTCDISGREPKGLAIYNGAQYYSQSTVTSAAVPVGEGAAITIPTFNFPTQPSLILCAVRAPYSATFGPPTGGLAQNSKPCAYLPIRAAAINYVIGNVLNTSLGQDRQLYDICRENGLDMTYAQWSGADISQGITQAGVAAPEPANPCYLGGGFLVLNPAKDLTSAKTLDQAEGTLANTGVGFQFSGQLTVANLTGAQLAGAEVQVIGVLPQQLYEVSYGSYKLANIDYSTSKVMMAESATIDYAEIAAKSEVVGSSLFGKLIGLAKTHGAQAVGALKTAAKFAPQALQYASKVPHIGKYATKFSPHAEKLKSLLGHGMREEAIQYALRKNLIENEDDIDAIAYGAIAHGAIAHGDYSDMHGGEIIDRSALAHQMDVNGRSMRERLGKYH